VVPRTGVGVSGRGGRAVVHPDDTIPVKDADAGQWLG